MKTLVENRLTVICLQALNWETVQRLRAELTQHCSFHPDVHGTFLYQTRAFTYAEQDMSKSKVSLAYAPRAHLTC